MLFLRTFRKALDQTEVDRLKPLSSLFKGEWRPLLRPALEAPAAILGVDVDILRQRTTGTRSLERIIDGEIFTDGRCIFVLSLRSDRTHSSRYRQVQESETLSLHFAYIGPDSGAATLPVALTTVENSLGNKLEEYRFSSDRFNELKSEDRESPSEASPHELVAARTLHDRGVRTLAVAIKSSGGLLVRDLAKQLHPESRGRVAQLIESLKTAGLVESEIMIVCEKTQAQITRVRNVEVFPELTRMAIKCACGRPLVDEQKEEALTITELGRELLDKSRWLTLLVVDELVAVGVSRDSILVEQQVGGDEIDCLANINGELALFELKDKEFNLGNAYSFGAKIGIIRPKYPVIFSTEHIGNDAKEHFVRAFRARAPQGQGFYGVFEVEETFALGEPDERSDITYVEGLQNLRSGIQRLVSGIYRQDAIRILKPVLQLGSMDSAALIQALESEPKPEKQGTEAVNGALVSVS
jgi:hypothetical protein